MLAALYKEETEQNALDVAQKTLITIVVSIGAILVVSMVISPIICRIEERKYTGLKFFLNVEHAHITHHDQQDRDFLALAFQEASVRTNNDATSGEGDAARLKMLNA